MPPPKRQAPLRTTAAIAEDLTFARRAGGLRKADAEALSATLDWLSDAGLSPDEEPLSRARDLLLHYTRNVCDEVASSEDADRTMRVAAASLERLLLRSARDTRLASVIRREALQAVGHNLTTDAVRHREDRMISQIAHQVSSDLQVRRDDLPQTVEAALHQVMPVLVDVRQDLHDLLCVTYPRVPPADPREQRVVDGYYGMTLLQLGDLLVAASQLVDVGLRAPNLARHEFAFANLGRLLVDRLFAEAGDREVMYDFTVSNESTRWDGALASLRSTDWGAAVYDRWVEWAGSCYSTCAFERTADPTYMCGPHAFLTLLYDFEVQYVNLGYRALSISVNDPVRHHALHGSRGVRQNGAVSEQSPPWVL
jgi:hypothetical protein